MIFEANDHRDLVLIATGRTSVGDANAAVARCLLVLAAKIEALSVPPAAPPTVEESVTPDSAVAQALMSPVLDPEMERGIELGKQAMDSVVSDLAQAGVPEPAPKSKKRRGDKADA